MRSRLGGCFAGVVLLAAAGSAVAHDFDHAPPSMTTTAPLSSAINAGGTDASWELVATIPTGNPQTDLDFFTRGGETYMSVGSLAAGPNGAGQNIIRLTENGAVAPSYVTGHPSATCPKATSSATGLQHDPEAAPKGTALPHFPNPHIVTSDTQVVVDATDATGRCHDHGLLATPLGASPPGGLEIIDVTDPENPVEIGLTTHVGMAHTVNVDPKRPHIAFVSSSDAMNLNAEGQRPNEVEGSTSNAFDGIEVVDMSSCMNFPAGTTITQKRAACDPQVFRYRWPNANFGRSHTYRDATGACHELEIYPDDTIVCAALMATVVLDFSDAFDDNGTPTNFADDKPKGTPLPCTRRASTTPSELAWSTGAMVVDCARTSPPPPPGEKTLRVRDWIEIGAPSLEGVTRRGTFHHMGFENQAQQNFNPAYPAAEDVFVAHEAELTQSGDFVLVTDERGGGVLPGGASCSPGADNPLGNGGIHAFKVSELGTEFPAEGAVEAYRERIYAKDSSGDKAVYRAPVRTEPQGSVCTSHVLQQIPGQNRIFMGWYSQGTQVVDFEENADGTIDFKTAGWFVPENANTWTSHIFKVERNGDGTFTYWGATGDFALGDAGRNAVDIYKATLPPPPAPRRLAPGTPTFPPADAAQSGCLRRAGFDRVWARPRGANRRKLRIGFQRRTDNGVRVQILRRTKGKRIVGRRIADFRNRKRAFTWSGRKAPRGFYGVRFITRAPNGARDVRHVAFRKRGGRLRLLPYFDRRAVCDLVRHITLSRPVVGGRNRVPLRMAFRLDRSARVGFTIRHRSGKVVRRVRAKSYAARKRNVVKLRMPRKAPRGAYRVIIRAQRPGAVTRLTLRTRYL